MKNSKLLACAMIFACVVLIAFNADAAYKEAVVANFSGLNGIHPQVEVVTDSDGNVYGAAPYGGKFGFGVVFRLTPPVDRKSVWKETILHAFTGESDGSSPSSSLAFDTAGNLYGTTSSGGAAGDGTVFRLRPGQGSSSWKEEVLYSFVGGNDGEHPWGSVTIDGKGNAYGITEVGGAGGGGTAFMLTPPRGGQTVWVETQLHSFGSENDGDGPSGGLVIDPAGNLYGTTLYGGGTGCGFGCGTVFQLVPPSGGQSVWTETLLYSFNNAPDGNEPMAGVILDTSGNVYGTTYGGDAFGLGTAFKLTPSGGQGPWLETILQSFNGGAGGANPEGGLVFDAAGNLYGTTSGGGLVENGTVFKLAPPNGGQSAWKETTLLNFSKNEGLGGRWPQAGVALDAAGNLYGTTYGGGKGGCYEGCGVVFQLKP